MPLKKDPQHGGTEADGRKSTMYCSHCYRNGKFILPDISAVQMQARVKRKMMEKGFPGFIAGLFARNVPKLERWTKAPMREDNLMKEETF
jgi:hypothetical protein